MTLIFFKKSMFFFCVAVTFVVRSQSPEQIFKAAGTPANPKVPISWNRYNDYKGVTDICKKIEKAHPDLVRLESMGKSVQGREMWVMTVTNFKKGKPAEKPGFYIDGNIHSNEIQGTEIVLYTAWFLSESFNENNFVRELLDDKVFYLAPTINPDARDDFMKAPNTMHTPRSGLLSLDDDRDGKMDEDGLDDLDGDGNITFMRRKSSTGKFKLDSKDSRRMIPVDADQFGEYEILGLEGLDNDEDGEINEDRPGVYDPNRDWGFDWQPSYVQNGALKYPFTLPETRSILNFVTAHPNIAGAQSYHNFGGMILRGPGAEEDKETYDASDAAVYDAIGKKGELMLPGYKYMVTYRDLYTVFGGENDWFYGCRGIYNFTNELFTNFMLFNKEIKGSFFETGGEYYDFDKFLLFEDAFVSWKPFNHPQYGPVEIGGFKKNYTRAYPGFLMESDAHRNMAFTLFHAYHTPKLYIDTVVERDLEGGLKEITATVSNRRLIPTHASHDIKNRLERPDYIDIEGIKVIAGMVVENTDFNVTKEQKNEPGRIRLTNIPGMGAVKVRWITSDKGKYTIIVDSAKGGLVKR